MLELSRSAFEDARCSRADIKDMAKQTAEVAEKARDDVKEMADRMVTMMAERKEEKAEGEKMAVSRLGEVPLVPRTVQGWAVRLGVVGNPDQMRHIGFRETKIAPEASRVLSMRIGDAEAALWKGVRERA